MWENKWKIALSGKLLCLTQKSNWKNKSNSIFPLSNSHCWSLVKLKHWLWNKNASNIVKKNAEIEIKNESVLIWRSKNTFWVLWWRNTAKQEGMEEEAIKVNGHIFGMCVKITSIRVYAKSMTFRTTVILF